MILHEPEIEFIRIDFKDAIVTSPGTGGGQRCLASQEDAHDCENWDTEIPWQ